MPPPKHKKVNYPKPPLSISDQVSLLESRGLIIQDRPEAEFYLSQINYYRFAAYCLPFEKDHATHQFQNGRTFNDVLNLYVFDRELRLLILDAIERIEVSLRTKMAYHLSHAHHSAHPHLMPEVFLNPLFYGRSICKLANDIQSSKEEFIKHLTNKYEEILPPIWASVELMTMGQLSKWFSNIKERRDRQAISREYGLDEVIVVSFCEHLALVRNHAAHHARLWNRDFTKTSMLPKIGTAELLNSVWTLPDTDRRGRKLYNTLTMIGFFMDVICPGHQWKARLKQLINDHQVSVSNMGFPADWATRPMWK